MNTTTSHSALPALPAAVCACEASPPHYLDSQQSLATRDALDVRVRQLIPCALVAQIWLLLFDADDVQMPLMMPIGELPHRPEHGFHGALALLHEEYGAASFVFVHERPGPGVLSVDDAAWLRALLEVPADAGYRVRAAYVAHDEGVGGFVDRGAVGVGRAVPAVRPGCGACRK
ncbi:hypothetical protein [Frondihabitans sp. PhB188]|uniref:hypothetical protein n=1 Tax=Frondihabitans sp. PhB188 TaxID=2485200 RepID=UPI000F4997CF|nr:hypothetical protein [Frondihabitans sp. PhB188]